MTEVVTFEEARRRVHPTPGGNGNRGQAEFFNRHELNKILQVYSRRVMSGEWLDYALGCDERSAVFAIYGGQSNMPVYSVVKRARNTRRQGGRYQVLARGRVLKTAPTLEDVLRLLDRRKPELVAD
jgi:hypothetical protein